MGRTGTDACKQLFFAFILPFSTELNVTSIICTGFICPDLEESKSTLNKTSLCQNDAEMLFQPFQTNDE